MSPALTALDAVIEQHGRSVVTDSVALAAALRGGTVDLPDAEIAALADAAGLVERLREALARDAPPEAALAEAAPGSDPQVRWAVATLGGALGLLPRRMADAEPTRRRGSGLLAPLAVAAVLVVGLGTAVAVADNDPAPAPPPPTTAAPQPAAAAAEPTGPLDGAPQNPYDAFTDPALVALAEPYISRPGVVCAPAREPGINVGEQVNCDLGRGWIGFFVRMLSPQSARELRDGYLRGAIIEAPGGVRSLRWKDVPGRPGVRTGIPAGNPDRGAGTRVRFVDDEGQPWLYFDRDDAPVHAKLIGPAGTTVDDLRRYWADPAR